MKPVPIVRSYQIDCRKVPAEKLRGRSGIIYHRNEKTVILVSQEEPPVRQRFTIMHEMGHFLLGHLGDIPFSRCEDDCRPAEEQAADKFAIDVLSPACVLWGLGIRTPEEIARICEISTEAATFRAERLRLLCQREKFLTHPLERRVYAQFLHFIRKNRKQPP